MDTVNIIIAACVTIFSLGLLVISLLSYNKTKNIKLIFVSMVFLILLIRGFLFSLSLFNNQFESFVQITYVGLLDLAILLLLFTATLKR